MKCITMKMFGLCVLTMGGAMLLTAAELPVTANLILRLDGSDVAHTNGVVYSWNNQATGAVVSANFIQSTESAKPLLMGEAIAGYRALKFDGSNDHLESVADSAWDWDYDSDPNNAARWTTFVVFTTELASTNGGNSRQHFIRTGYNDIQEGSGIDGHGSVWGSWLFENDYKIHGRSSAGSYVEAVWKDSVETGAWHIVAGRFQNAVVPSLALFVDGVLRATQNKAITRQMNGHIRSCIGSDSSSVKEVFKGMIAEILVYKEVLSDSQMDEVNEYLQLKYASSPIPTLEDGLVLHCPMDNEYVDRNGVKPPPTLTTDDGDWTVENWINPATNGTALSYNTSGSVISSQAGMINEGILIANETDGKGMIDFGTADAFEAGSGSLSVSLWVKPADITNGVQIIAAHGNGGSAAGGWAIFSSAGSTAINLRCCNTVDAPDDSHKAARSYGGLVNGQWYHVVLVLDRFGNKLRAYINGSEDGTGLLYSSWGDTFSFDPISTDKPLLIGIRNSGYDYPFKGAVDDFAIWKRALTGAEVAEIYAKGVQGETFMKLPPPLGTVIIIR